MSILNNKEVFRVGEVVYPKFDNKENAEYFAKRDIREDTPMIIIKMNSGCLYFSVNGVESTQYNCFFKRVTHKPPFSPVLLDEDLFTI